MKQSSKQSPSLQTTKTFVDKLEYICRRCGRWVNSGHDSGCPRKLVVAWDEGREQAVRIEVGGGR
jgi:hypothetical protein